MSEQLTGIKEWVWFPWWVGGEGERGAVSRSYVVSLNGMNGVTCDSSKDD